MVHKHEKGSGSVAKRLLGLCLALVMLCGVFVPTFASVAGVDDQQPQQEQTEQQPAAPAEDANTGDEGAKKDDAGNVSGDAKDESDNTGDGTGDTGDAKDENAGDAKDESTGDVKDDTTGDGETKEDAKDESKDAKDEDVKDADESDAADANVANGIATYAAPNPVTTGIANNTNIKVNMFNYTGKINEGDAVLYFWNAANQNAVDDASLKLVRYGTRLEYDSNGNHLDDKAKIPYSSLVDRTLKDGYPTISDKTLQNPVKYSLQYLFDPDRNATKEQDGFTAWKAAANSGLFKSIGNGYLQYDSADNAAYFDTSNPSNPHFVLYDGVVRPDYTKDTTAPGGTNFLPFNPGSQFIEDTSSKSSPTRYKLGDGQVDLWFGMTVEFEFLMPEKGFINGDVKNPMMFEFKGDDDVLVYIDDVLVLNIGGAHGAENGTINFATGECESTQYPGETLKSLFTKALGVDNINEADWSGNTFANYTTHKLKFFYLERGGNISYCKLRFNIQTLPEKSLTIGKELTTDADVALTNYLKQTYTYKFRVLKAGTSELYVPKNTEYTLVDSRKYEPLLDANGNPRTGKVDENGYIYLKAGEYAQFTNMAQYGGASGPYDYVVEETLPDNLTGQYGKIEYAIGAGTGKETTENTEEKDFTGYQTGTLSALLSQIIVYNNQVATKEMGQLTIKKVVTGTENSTDDFTMEVKLGGKLLAVGTKYKIGTTEKTVAEEGKITLKAGETAIIENILAGTTFEVKETGLVDNTSYKFECEKVEAKQLVKDGDDVGKPVGTAEVNNETKVASGTVGVNGAVSIVVTNKYTPKTTTVTVKKIVAGLLGDKDKTFNFTWEYTVNNDTKSGNFNLTNYDPTKDNVFELKDVPIGATVTIKETNAQGYTTSYQINNGTATGIDAETTSANRSMTTPEITGATTITFTNTKDADPDTGIFLDSMPYIMALVIVAGGAAVFFLRRRKKSED